MQPRYYPQTTADTIVKHLSNEIDGKVVLTTVVSPSDLDAFFNEYIAPAKPKLLILAERNSSKNQTTADALLNTYPQLKTRTLELDLEPL